MKGWVVELRQIVRMWDLGLLVFSELNSDLEFVINAIIDLSQSH